MSSFRNVAIRAVAWANVATSRAASIAPRSAYAQNAVRPFSVMAPRALARTLMLRDEPKQETDDAAAATRAGTSQQAEEARHEVPRSLWVQNMVYGLADEEITEAFSKYGEVSRVFRTDDKSNWAFVIFKDVESVRIAAENVDGTFWHGRRLRAMPRRARTPGLRREQNDVPMNDTLFISGLPYDMKDEELNDLFSDMEGVKNVRIAVDKATGWPLGYAHAWFSSVETAQKAFDKLQGTQIRGSNLRVSPSRGRKEKKQQREQQQQEEQQQQQQQQQQQDGNNA
ncbi:RNA-binding domain-containing protein [Sodiomyces alkalinus F11]|uniref:RNA-binding domain-containing protein n=1 Tax=Sodiomyces alkalinus (strain CBS 110278 / VKM F-3762 / F11) TaxID=1314773 RepID=A0A3N2PM67_SODAK|nr:RNA-binding domain-containing protein [Sodiomyces alkalinus F11]ROT35608.1 RNA-binding domain-containing protein [Sodiomyces alkalinus F11]